LTDILITPGLQGRDRARDVYDLAWISSASPHAGERLDGRDFTLLDLGDPARGDTHDLSEPRLGEAKALALLGKLEPPLLGHDRAAAASSLPLANMRTVGVSVPPEPPSASARLEGPGGHRLSQ
jgi:hypothetical protein